MAEDEDTTIDESTIHLNGAPDDDIGNPRPTAKAVQAFQIELAHETVREMQQYMRNAKSGIQLMFGRSPLLRYGTKSMPLRITPSAFRTEIYKGDDKRELHFRAIVTHTITTVKTDNILESVEPGLVQLQQRLATLAKEKEENRATFIDGVRDPKKMLPKKAPVLLRKKPAMQQAVRQSMPASPAITASTNAAVASNNLQVPNAPPNPVSDAHRFAVLHFIALKPAKQEVIVQKTGVPTVDTLNVLRKFGVQYGDEYLWRLSDRAYRYLDVWKFPYQSQQDRQFVIDNAIKAFDRQRISTADKLWDSLLPEEQRGKGKILSKLDLNKIHTQPKDQVPQHRLVQKDSQETQDLSNHRSFLANLGGEPMARDTSLESIVLKKTESEARIKRIINKKPLKTSTPKMPPKVVAKKDGEVSNKVGGKRATAAGTPSQQREQNQHGESNGFATEEDGDRVDDMLAAGTASANEKTTAQVAAVNKKSKQSRTAGQPKKAEKEFKSAERVDDSDDGLSESEFISKTNETERMAKQSTNDISTSKTSSSVSGKTSSTRERLQKPDTLGKLQRPTISKRDYLKEGSSTPGSVNHIKKADATNKGNSLSAQKLKSTRELKQGVSSITNSNKLTTASPKATTPIVTKKKPTATNVGLGISLGGVSAQKGERTITINKVPLKKPAPSAQNEDVAKENHVASNAAALLTAVRRPPPANQTQAAKGDAAPTDSSANSWASSLSAKSTPMHRQSSSQSSISIQLSEMPPKNRKRPASPPASRQGPPVKKLKQNGTSPATELKTPLTGKGNKGAAPIKPSPQGSSSSLSEAQSVSPPSIPRHSDEISPGFQKVSEKRVVQTPTVPDFSLQQISHTESIVNAYHGTSQAATFDPVTNREEVELGDMKEQIRGMYAAYIKRRMEHDKADAGTQEIIREELSVAWVNISELSDKIKERASTLESHEWHFGLPPGLELDPDVVEYCRSKLESVRQDYNTLSRELNALPKAEQSDEGRMKLRNLYAEFKELYQITYPMMQPQSDRH